MQNKLLIIVVVLGVISIATGTVFMYGKVFIKPPLTPSINTEPDKIDTPEKNVRVTLGELVLCKDFQKIEVISLAKKL